MGADGKQRKSDFEEQVDWPWDWSGAPYRCLDGWEINKNRVIRDKFLEEMGREIGPFSIPHRRR